MRKYAFLFLLLFAAISSNGQSATVLKYKIDTCITNKTGPRTITAAGVGARMKEVVDYAKHLSDSAFDAMSDIQASAEWDSILNKPSTFPPSSHTHSKSEVIGLQGALDSNIKTETDPLFDTKFAAKTTNNLTENTNLYFTTARARSAISATGSLSYNSGTGVLSYTAPSSYAWNTITGTPTTLAGYGITDAASSSHTHTFASLTSKPTTLSGYGITDAEAVSNKATTITASNTLYPTNTAVINYTAANFQPIGSYVVDLTPFTTDNLAQGSSNKYYATSLFNTDLATKTTDDLTQGSTNKYFSNTQARAAVSATGDISYNSGTGVFSYTAPTTYPWASVTGTPTTLLGYGITDAEPTVTATTSADYYRGDKTFATLNKTAVGLGNVDNTSDVNKPVSTAQQTAIDAKVTQTITNSVTATAPSEDAVFDALATYQDFKQTSIGTSVSPVPTGDARENFYDLTSLSFSSTSFQPPSGTPANHNRLTIRITATGGAPKNLGWDAIYRAGTTVTLPASIAPSSTIYLNFIYNSTATKWDLIGLWIGF